MKIPPALLPKLNETRGWFQTQEGATLARLAGDVFPDEAIVEVGAYAGRSTGYLAAGAMYGRGAHVTSIDPWGPAAIPGGTDQAAADEVLDYYLARLYELKLERQVTSLRAKGTDVAPTFLRRIGLLFIDSTHYYADTRDEIAAWEPRMASGAFAAFHDYDPHPAHAGVVQATDEAVASGRWKHYGLTCSLRVLERA